ncbi:MAG: glycogen synthase GlgA [Candidatus Wallbacteria bacterium]|nr:glycogen synthase GlgA [Candidatus Wallbacteria bacterium]
MKELKVLLAASEASPFAKTGGLADVAGSLPAALSKLGVDCRLIIPKYKSVYNMRPNTSKVGEFSVNLAGNVYLGEVEEAKIPKTQASVYFIKNDRFFFRDELYQVKGRDYDDNASRFIFFSRAVLEVMKIIQFKPDIIFANDWQTGLIPAYLKSPLYSDDVFYHGIKTVFSIHNLAYQGIFWHLDMPLTGLGWDYFTPEKIEFYGKINLLKAGIVFADQITTVSPTYAREIQTQEMGCGLEGLLAERSNDLVGIVNGIDYETWNPENDKLIQKTYNSGKSAAGKAKNKLSLLEMFGLPIDDRPLIGIVSRLDEQKGIDLLHNALSEIMGQQVKLVILGKGKPEYEEFLAAAAAKHPDKLGVRIEFNEKIAHQIQAGADIFLMPSKVEPCGLNQLYALRYGTIPVVRKTGGLSDTIIDFDPADGSGNGFVFEEYNPLSMIRAIKRVCETYRAPKLWKKLVNNAMEADFSWNSSAQKYKELFEKVRS